MPIGKTLQFEVLLKITVYADSQADAIAELEKRIHPVPTGRDEYALVLAEVHAKRLGAARQ